MSTRSTDRGGRDRFTVLIVPESGRGEVRQLTVSRTQVQSAVGGVVATVLLLGAGTAANAWSVPQAVEGSALAQENAELRARLADVDERLATLEPLLDRVRAYDEQLRQLEAREALPGFGPLDLEESKARQAWIDGVVSRPSGARREVTLEARLAGIEDTVDALVPGLSDYPKILARFGGVQSALPQLWPVDGVLTSPFGYRHSPFGRQWKMHTGLDIGASWGTPILSTNDGLVSFSGWDQGHGYTVEIDHGHGVTTRYCHASRLLVDAGDLVSTGEVIALVGSTGMSTGPHLHYEILVDGEKVDPLPYLP